MTCQSREKEVAVEASVAAEEEAVEVTAADTAAAVAVARRVVHQGGW